MTTTATLTLAEDAARLVAAALADNVEIGADAIDLHEAEPRRWQVVAYFGNADRRQRTALKTVAARVAGEPVAPAWRTLVDTDWVARSQAALPPVRAGRIVVFGRHDRDKIRENEIAIAIEAAQAFGTGHHGTTQGCLLAIQAVAKSRRIKTAVDVGTGSGVLAIALARSGTRVLATEIDPVAAAIARENARANRVAARVRVAMMPGQTRRLPRATAGGCDLVVANILMSPLMTLAPAIRRAVAPGGTVILSGLLPQQRAPIVATYRGLGLRLKRWSVLDGWLTIILERPRRGDRTRVQLRAVPRVR